MKELDKDLLSIFASSPEDINVGVSISDAEKATRGALDGKRNVYYTDKTVPVGNEFTADFELSKDPSFGENQKMEITPSFGDDQVSTILNQLPESAKGRFAYLAAAAKGDTENFSNNFALSRESIDAMGDNLIRQDAIQRGIDAGIQGLTELVNSGVQDREVLDKSIQLVQQKIEAQDQYELERQAIDAISEFGERNPTWSDFKLYHRPIVAEAVEQSKKDAIISSFLAKEAMMEEASPWLSEFFDDAVEAALSMIGDDLISGFRSRDWNASASWIRAEGQRIRSLPSEEIPAALEDFKAQLLKTSSLFVEDDEDALANMTTAFGSQADVYKANDALALEGFLTLFGAAAEVKGVRHAMKRLGNKDMVSSEASKVLTTKDIEGTSYSTVEEAAEDLMPMTTKKYDTGGISSAIVDDIKATEEALVELTTMSATRRLTDAEAATAANKRIKQLKKIYGKDHVENLGVSYDRSKGVYELTVTIGKRDGSGYATESSAKGFMNKANIQGEVIQAEDGFYIKQVQPVTESMADEGFTNYRPVGLIKRVFQAPKAFVDRHIGNLGTDAAFNEARAAGVVKDIYNKNIGNLPKKDFDEVGEILNRGLTQERWYSPEELRNAFQDSFGKEISDNQVRAYYAAKNISDYGHYVQSAAIFKEKAAKGLETINLNFTKHGDFDANVYTDPADFQRVASKARIWDAGKDQIIHGTPEELERLSKQGYTLIRPEDASWTVDEFGEGASIIATKANKSITIKPLEFGKQLNYVAGGRRIYADEFFVGQRRSGTFSDGTKYTLAPRIFRSAATETEAKAWIDSHNSANKILASYRSGKLSGEEANTLLEPLVGKTAREYDEFVEIEGWDIAEEFAFKKNRGEFPVDYEMRDAVRMYNPDSLESHFGVNKPGRLSARGDRLKNVNEVDSEVYDFVTAMNESTSQAIKMGVYTDFKINAVNRFNTTFRKYMKDTDKLTPYEIATKGEIDEKLLDDLGIENPEKIYNAIKGHQFYINSIMRSQTSWDKTVQRGMSKLARWVEGYNKDLAVSIHKATNPIEKIRGINYDLNLGMFNPKQLLLQANSALVALALDPVNGMKAWKQLPLFRYALIGNDYKTTAHLGKIASSLTGDADDMIDAVEQFRRLGFNDFGTNIAMMDAQNTLGATTNRLASKASRFREAGRVFFQEGERYGRITSYLIARNKYAKANPGAKLNTEAADNWIRAETDRLMLSPNSDNNQFFTKGITALPTQFWSYMGKLSDAVLTGSGGRYTGMERVRLISSQALFYGAAGVPMADLMLEDYEKSTGTVLDPVAAKMLHNGLIDTMIYAASGGEINTDFSGTSGLGGFWSQMVQNLAENPVMTLVGGATGSNLAGGWKTIVNQAKITGLTYNPTPENVTLTALAGIGSMVKSVNSLTQSILAYNTGIWYDRYGRPLANVSKGEAIASLGGMPPQAINDVYKILSDNKAARDTYVNDVANMLQALHLKYMNAETDEERTHIAETINALSSISIQTGHFDQASSQFLKFMGSKTYQDSLIERLSIDVQTGKAGYNPNLLPKEIKEQMVE